MRISDWSSDVCSSDLHVLDERDLHVQARFGDHLTRIAELHHQRLLRLVDGEQRTLEQDAGGDHDDGENDEGAVHGVSSLSASRSETRATAKTMPVAVAALPSAEIGRASCRARVCQYV